MLTHARIFVENILQQVMLAESLPDEPRANLKESLDLLNEKGYLTSDIKDALHHVRQIGNKAAHDSRRFRYSEALLSCR
jgi:DNA-directed RNA polymerase specialized sigma54-like protein